MLKQPLSSVTGSNRFDAKKVDANLYPAASITITTLLEDVRNKTPREDVGIRKIVTGVARIAAAVVTSTLLLHSRRP